MTRAILLQGENYENVDIMFAMKSGRPTRAISILHIEGRVDRNNIDQHEACSPNGISDPLNPIYIFHVAKFYRFNSKNVPSPRI